MRLKRTGNKRVRNWRQNFDEIIQLEHQKLELEKEKLAFERQKLGLYPKSNSGPQGTYNILL